MAEVTVIGGGLAGLAAAAALGGAGYQVDVFETRWFLGGRATSYPVTAAAETIDNCQHILLRCCVNLLDFYQRLQVRDRIRFHREFFFIEPGGRTSTLKSGIFPAPAHFTESFAKLRFLTLADKLSLARGILALRREHGRRADLDHITMADWLREKRQTPRAIERFWRQVLVSAINEELDRMAAAHGFQVFRLGFLASPHSSDMGVPAVPLGDLYTSEAWSRLPGVTLRTRETIKEVIIEDAAVTGVRTDLGVEPATRLISAVPFERIPALLPQLDLPLEAFEHCPITGIHLWFDRPITQLPHATLLDRTIQWMFNKDRGRYLQLVVSASRSLTPMSRADVIALAVRELAEFFPTVAAAKLEKAHVVKEVRATFSAKPGLERLRPESRTAIRGLYLAGDWTRSGWPATMEGAVRSGYLAAEALAEADRRPQRFLLPDIA
ncbi:MAG: FAD-dependent oxidoreductase [Acidobacteria bacterium]|nr:FAD-dependent oxidoreductase [Acidobacteriota bacterium]